MTRTDERGVALVFTLFLMAALSAMAVSMMFLAQTETSASRNYKTMSQARYAGEAGVQRAIHYLSSTTYTSLVTSTAGFITTVSPVTDTAGNVVILSPVRASSTYPSSATNGDAIKDAYAALFTGASMSVGSGATVTYGATATLISMRLVTVYGGSPQVVQTWRIAATGTVPGTLPATVEVAAILERDAAAAETYAVFATGNGCGALTMVGNVSTDSYDSANMPGGTPVISSSGGSVGTNGNLSIAGQVTVNGNLDTPRTGVGACTTGNVTASTTTGTATINGDTIQLPQAKVYPTPTVPSPGTADVSINGSTSASPSCPLAWGISIPDTCSIPTNGNVVITKVGSAPISWRNVSMSGGATLTINTVSSTNVNVNVNTWSLSGNSNVVLGSSAGVTLNVTGSGLTTGQTAVDFTGGALTNGSLNPAKFQIVYAGTNIIKVGGSSDTSATIYAPNAKVDMNGSAGFYGSVLSGTFVDNGGARLHYDRNLANQFSTLGNHVMSSFSWQKY